MRSVGPSLHFVSGPIRSSCSAGVPRFGYHADFLAAWEEGVLDAAVQVPQCTDQVIPHSVSDRQMERCAASFTKQADQDAPTCHMDLPLELVA